MGREKPKRILATVFDYNWTEICEYEGTLAPIITSKTKASNWWDMTHFTNLHELPRRVLQNDPESPKAKEFLPKLGICHNLFRRVLKRIGTNWPLATSNTSEICDDLHNIASFLVSFLNCLAPLPTDRPTDTLVRNAHNKLLVTATRADLARDPNMGQRPALVDNIHKVIMMLEAKSWKRLKKETPAQRFERFAKCHKLANVDKNQIKAERKRMKGALAKEVSREIGTHEMCANCYILETEISTGLLKCSQCRRITYCSTKCQLEHWKKAHKKLCKKKS
jgi:hypothetical protein